MSTDNKQAQRLVSVLFADAVKEYERKKEMLVSDYYQGRVQGLRAALLCFDISTDDIDNIESKAKEQYHESLTPQTVTDGN